MSIKSPATYGEWYWKLGVDADKAFDEVIEDAVSPFLQGVFNDIPNLDLLPAGMRAAIYGLAEPQRAGLGGFALGVGVETIDEGLRVALKPLMTMLERKLNERSLETWLNSTQANLLHHRKKIPADFWNSILASEGYEEVLRHALYDAQAPYPTIPELVLYSRYHGEPDNVWSTIQEYYDVDPVDFPIWDWLGRMRIGTDQTQTLYKRDLIGQTEFHDELSRIGWAGYDLLSVEELAYLLPNAMLMVQGGLMQGESQDNILANISRADIHPDYAQKYLDAVLTKPASLDIVAYELRKDPSLSNLDQRLQQIGIHPAFTPVYKELAYQIPPVADIITMAVREAFTPSIAAKFGQYEDYPKELETWGLKKGLSAEWTQRYWAAHWSLPSPQQGFEMLHRGVINQDELNMLLRALDVMPFWRDKLTEIAFRPLTRVDVRRMYREGVLEETEVYESYRIAGYNEQNAERMAEFTVRQTLATLSKFKSGDIVKAFTNRMISESEAMSLLRMIGIRDEDARYVISTAEYKRLWAFTDQQISGIRNLFKKRVYDENQTRDKLSRLNLPAEQINVLMEQWFYEKVEELDATWTTPQTLAFLKKDLITVDRAKKELMLNGYNVERTNIYIKNALWTKPKS